jgi:hypothetical protein
VTFLGVAKGSPGSDGASPYLSFALPAFQCGTDRNIWKSAKDRPWNLDRPIRSKGT